MIPTKLIKSKDFHTAWFSLNKSIIREGFGIPSDNDESKMTRDICATIELTGEAIRQIERREVHPDCPMKAGLNSYLEQFRYDSDEFKKSDEEQEYTYAGRMLTDAQVIHEDKLLKMYDRGIQLTTWNKYRDLGHHTRPCLQRIWIRKLNGKDCELHMTYRSHDAYGAWQFNMIALVDYARRYLTKGLEIVKIVEFNDSLHIYDYDWDKASRVGKPTRNFRDGYE